MNRTQAAVGGAVVVALVIHLATVMWILKPGQGDPPRSDAIVVMVGGRGERLAVTRELATAGVADHVVVAASNSPSSSTYRRLCDGEFTVDAELHCIPAVSDTRAEARALARYAESQGWTSIIVVTSSYHVTRASLLVERCFSGTVHRAARTPDIGPGVWFGLALHEWGGLIESQVKRGC